MFVNIFTFCFNAKNDWRRCQCRWCFFVFFIFFSFCHEYKSCNDAVNDDDDAADDDDVDGDGDGDADVDVNCNSLPLSASLSLTHSLAATFKSINYNDDTLLISN